MSQFLSERPLQDNFVSVALAFLMYVSTRVEGIAMRCINWRLGDGQKQSRTAMRGKRRRAGGSARPFIAKAFFIDCNSYSLSSVSIALQLAPLPTSLMGRTMTSSIVHSVRMKVRAACLAAMGLQIAEVVAVGLFGADKTTFQNFPYRVTAFLLILGSVVVARMHYLWRMRIRRSDAGAADR
ncbi:membrane hypothetical protein [Burkholderia sp. 8Y]|uniref:hypothetical protein n=1 Tax=Burkholderia sp. 8Y TaxID=2653133 RepID=UPI0012F30526|nr:hypothetical protein [Burkholderia sp. 8Y]VXC90990.1 membrane hypothetical protein [Burkholderia sp. 8Y]